MLLVLTVKQQVQRNQALKPYHRKDSIGGERLILKLLREINFVFDNYKLAHTATTTTETVLTVHLK